MKISIITINYNNASGLQRTINSVKKQTSRNFEFIIIDGGSSDESLSIIKNNYDIITKYISEKDNGIYNALNKGTNFAKGDYCIYMNSGDEFYSKDVIQNFINSNPKSDFEVGGTCFLQPEGNTNLYFPQPLTTFFILKENYNHQSMFIKRKIALKYPYDERYKICADYNFFISALVKDGCSLNTLNFIVAIYEMTGLSSLNKELREKEKQDIINNLNLPILSIKEYSNIPYQWFNLMNKMIHCGRFGSLLFHINIFLIKVYKLFNKSK